MTLGSTLGFAAEGFAAEATAGQLMTEASARREVMSSFM
jgi:hypothetical protein